MSVGIRRVWLATVHRTELQHAISARVTSSEGLSKQTNRSDLVVIVRVDTKVSTFGEHYLPSCNEQFTKEYVVTILRVTTHLRTASQFL